MSSLVRFLLLPSVLFIGLAAACADGDPERDDAPDRDDDGVVLGATVSPDDDGDDVPEPNEIPGIIRDRLERAFGDAEWIGDVEDIQRDGDTVRFKLDRTYAGDSEAFMDACSAVTGLLTDIPLLDVEKVEVEDESGDVVIATADGSEDCEVVRR